MPFDMNRIRRAFPTEPFVSKIIETAEPSISIVYAHLASCYADHYAQQVGQWAAARGASTKQMPVDLAVIDNARPWALSTVAPGRDLGLVLMSTGLLSLCFASCVRLALNWNRFRELGLLLPVQLGRVAPVGDVTQSGILKLWQRLPDYMLSDEEQVFSGLTAEAAQAEFLKLLPGQFMLAFQMACAVGEFIMVHELCHLLGGHHSVLAKYDGLPAAKLDRTTLLAHLEHQADGVAINAMLQAKPDRPYYMKGTKAGEWRFSNVILATSQDLSVLASSIALSVLSLTYGSRDPKLGSLTLFEDTQMSPSRRSGVMLAQYISLLQSALAPPETVLHGQYRWRALTSPKWWSIQSRLWLTSKAAGKNTETLRNEFLDRCQKLAICSEAASKAVLSLGGNDPKDVYSQILSNTTRMREEIGIEVCDREFIEAQRDVENRVSAALSSSP